MSQQKKASRKMSESPPSPNYFGYQYRPAENSKNHDPTASNLDTDLISDSEAIQPKTTNSRNIDSLRNFNNRVQMNYFNKLSSQNEYEKLGGSLTDNDDEYDINNKGNNDVANDVIAELPHLSNRYRSSDHADRDDVESVDEFNHNLNPYYGNNVVNNKVVKTGRQRKKEAARSKGGEFQAKRKKKRIYFCCVSSEIDVEKLHDYFIASNELQTQTSVQSQSLTQAILMNHNRQLAAADTINNKGQSQSQQSSPWLLKMYSDVLHLHKPGRDNVGVIGPTSTHGGNHIAGNLRNQDLSPTLTAPYVDQHENALSPPPTSRGEGELPIPELIRAYTDPTSTGNYLPGTSQGGAPAITTNDEDTYTRISASGAQEVFIFDFGAVVFWGFPRGEEEHLLKTIRMFITKGYVKDDEFPMGEDDMAYVCSAVPAVGLDDVGINPILMPLVSSSSLIAISNDVLTLPDDSPAKQRLSLSFAIAQSAVLAIFESRIDRKIVEYKYIPEMMAKHGRIHLSERQLGTMIGEVFVIRHDVNLHTEILDLPDFFWKDGEKYEGDYKLIMSYLQMGARTEVLNKRLDMMRELLDVLQQQMENDHGVKLEWIVIWLIVVEVALQMIAIFVDSLAWSSKQATD